MLGGLPSTANGALIVHGLNEVEIEGAVAVFAEQLETRSDVG